MLNIYTSKSSNKRILDIESRFSVLIKSGENFDNEVYNTIIKMVDNISYRDGDIIENKFGRTTIENLSTGCKAVLIAILYEKYDYAISIDECGENALKVLFKLGEKLDLKLYASSFVNIKDNSIVCNIDGNLVKGGYQIFKRLEELNE